MGLSANRVPKKQILNHHFSHLNCHFANISHVQTSKWDLLMLKSRWLIVKSPYLTIFHYLINSFKHIYIHIYIYIVYIYIVYIYIYIVYIYIVYIYIYCIYIVYIYCTVYIYCIYTHIYI